MAQVNDSIQQQRRALLASGELRGPTPIAATMSRVLARIDAAPDPSAEELAERQAVKAQQEREQERQRRREAWEAIARRAGRRYAACTLDNYRTDTGPQTLALEAVRAYCTNLADNLRDGRGALLYGPPGTGKDHFAAAIMRHAVLRLGAKVEWTDGAEFYGQVRDNIDGTKSESAFLQKFTRPDLLVMSDPLPPAGRVDSSFQLSMVFRVIDRRYRDLKATVMTLNVASRQEAEQRLSPNIIDRLSHGALAVHCNWPSFRT